MLKQNQNLHACETILLDKFHAKSYSRAYISYSYCLHCVQPSIMDELA
jgi:hypothetical protein